MRYFGVIPGTRYHSSNSLEGRPGRRRDGNKCAIGGWCRCVGWRCVLRRRGRRGDKSGRLDADEFAVVKGHTIAGQALVKCSVVLADIGPVVRGHHERIDGGGYRDRLVGEQIPSLARIVSVCDAYDAMAFTRLYREGLGHDRAIEVLQEHAGARWDPVVVAAAAKCLDASLQAVSPLDSVGRAVAIEDAAVREWCSCGDAIPDALVGSR